MREKTTISKPKRKFSIVRFLMRAAFFCAFWGAIALTGVIYYYSRDLPDTNKLLAPPSSHAIRILDNKGEFLTSIGGSGKNVAFSDLPPHLIQAVVATEDRRFFEHFGIDVYGLFRAVYENYKAGRIVQGGSTITQQLTKVIFLTPERTIKRKIQEAILAVWVESKFTKEEIMEMYMNRVYLGGGNYGIDSASRSYFGKPASELNLGESAIIAGLLKAPSRYSPHNNKELSEKRARQVLSNMVEAGYISSEEVAEKVNVLETYTGSLNSSFYFTEWVAAQIPEYIGPPESNITVLTTLDSQKQQYAEEALRKILDQNEAAMKVHQGALLSIKPTGEVLAMVGGKDFRKSQFNRVVQALRQPGSSFKLFVYLAALKSGYTPEDVFEDTPIEVDGWAPANYKEEYLGEMTIREAFARSINTIAVQLSEIAGRNNVINMAHLLGIEENIEPTPAIALGTTETTLLEMVQAYAHIANSGQHLRAFGINEIRNDKGEVLFKRGDYEPPMAIDDYKVILNMNDLLTNAVMHGTGRRAYLGRPTAGKTGTSQDFRDAWFIGFTPQIVTGVWVGNDDNSPTKKVTGGTLPADIFKTYMSIALKDVEELPIPTTETSSPDEATTQAEEQPLHEEKEEFWDNIVNDTPTDAPANTAPPAEQDKEIPPENMPWLEDR